MKVYFVSLLWLLTACASGRVQVLSSPAEAEVYVGRDGKAPEKIGVTPLRVPAAEIFGGAQEYVQLELRKDGFDPESILVPQAMFGLTVDLSVKLAANLSGVQGANQAALQKVARGIATAQLQISQRQFDNAEVTLNSLLAEYPQISVFHDLLGNVHYLRKDLRRALESYEQALRLDPENIETDRLVRRLRTMTDRLPSSGGI